MLGRDQAAALLRVEVDRTARVEEAAQARGVSPSSLMRALIAAGLDRSYAAVREPTDLGAEVAELRRLVERLADRLDAPGRDAPEGAGA